MSVASTDIIGGPHDLDGVTVAFSFPFDVPGNETSYVQVIITETDGTEHELTETTHYSVTATNMDFSLGPGGTVTITTAIRDLYTTGTITIILNVPFLQSTDYHNSDDLPKEQIEDDFDLAAYRDLRLLALIQRVLHVPLTDAAAGSLEIPNKATRANNVLGFNADGFPIAALASGFTASSFMGTVLDDTTAGAALTTLGFSDFIKTLIAAADQSALGVLLGFMKGYVNLSMTEMDSTNEPTFTGVVEVNGTLVTLSAASGTGWSGLATNSRVVVYVTSAGAVVYSTSTPTWDSAKGGYYNSNDRAVAWVLKDSSDEYRYKHFFPKDQRKWIIFEDWVTFTNWDMDADAATAVALYINGQFLIDLTIRIFADGGAGYSLLGRHINASGVDGGAGGSWYISATNPLLIAVTRANSGFFDSTNFDDTESNRGIIRFSYLAV